MSRRAVITACSGDPGYFEKVLDDWWPSLEASSDLSDTDAWLMEYGIRPDQREQAERAGLHVLSLPRDGAVNNLRWRDLPRVFEAGGDYAHVLVTDGSDIYFQEDVDGIFRQARERIAVVCEHRGELSRDIYLERSADCLDREELLFCLRRPTINSGLLSGPQEEILALCRFVSDRVDDRTRDVVGPDQCLVHLYLHRRGFQPMAERYNFIAITSKVRPQVIGGRLCVDRVPVHVIHNAAAGFGVFTGFGFPNDGLGIDGRVLTRLRRKWRRYAISRRLPILRRRTWGGRVLAGGAPTVNATGPSVPHG